MKRREFIRRMGAAAVSAGSLPLLSSLGMTGCARGSGKRPNVILVMTDDQGYGDIGAHGSPYVKTPTLDALAGESVRLTNFHVDPCCAPTRSSLLTGQYSIRSGIWHTIGGRSLLRRDKTTLADVFRDDGYETGIFGKWHLGENYPFRPQDRGFGESLIHGGGAVGPNPDFWGNDYFDDTFRHNGVKEKFEGYCNTVWFDQAMRFIKDNRDRPFFCYIPTNIPHAPLNVEEKYVEPYRGRVSERLARYYGMLTRFDEDFSRLLDLLRQLDLENDTILIFMSDNGPCPWYGGIIINKDGFVEEGYSAGMRGGKIWGYENAHRVPCYVRWPAGGIGGGRDVDVLTAHFDLMPTLIESCGLQPPEEAYFDGKSLMPLLTGAAGAWPERTLFVHNQRVEFPVKYKEYQVMTERWRLVKRDRDELYDIRSDPGQRRDLADQFPDIVDDLRRRYEDWWEDAARDIHLYNEIIIGSDRENPATLYSHDAHRKNRKRVWVVRVERDGLYRFRAFRWLEESGKPITENREGEPDPTVTTAHLVIGSAEPSFPVEPDMRFVEFSVHLKAGPTCLQAFFTTEKSPDPISAGSVMVERIGPADPDESGRYTPSDPDDLLRGDDR